jgi:hypothetical protein
VFFRNFISSLLSTRYRSQGQAHQIFSKQSRPGMARHERFATVPDLQARVLPGVVCMRGGAKEGYWLTALCCFLIGQLAPSFLCSVQTCRCPVQASIHLEVLA